MSNPQISVGLPVYNGETYLGRALASLINQDFENFEIIISDNASTDATQSICSEFASKDPRIRYYRNPKNLGATKNYNRVFELARAPFFKWASHDDEYHPALLKKCFEVYKSSPPSTVLVFPKAEIIDEDGQVKHLSPDDIASVSTVPLDRIARVLMYSTFANPLWGLIKSEALRKTRLMGTLAADHVLLTELASLGNLIEFPDVLHKLRRHKNCAMQITRSDKELLAWHDPNLANKRLFLRHRERLCIEHVKGVFHSSSGITNKLVCSAAVPLVYYWRLWLPFTSPLRKGGKFILRNLGWRSLHRSY
jgi:glycosyltransferase involved in cell wall biosynthesis